MSPTFYEFRIEFTVGRLPFTWVRSGPSLEKVRELAQRAIQEQYGHWATVKAVERVRG